MKALVVGYGSIGSRHARLLKPMLTQLAVVSSQQVKEFPVYASLEKAVNEFQPDYIVIASITSAHGDQLKLLKQLGYKGTVLVEKPLFAHAKENASPYPFTIHVAYQLRFHRVVQALKEALKNSPALSAHVYVGQHLAQWRPGRDIKATYSANRAQGGGVLRDLSHELDMVTHLFGPIKEWHAIGGRTGDVTKDSDDAVAFALSCERCPVVSLQMNCLDHLPRREWIVNTKDASFKADLVQHTLATNQNIASLPGDADDAYRAMHEAILNGRSGACRLEEGLALVELIDKVPLFN